MAGGLSQTYKKKSLDFILGIATINAGTILPVYVALSSTLPTDAGGNVTEPIAGNWNNYARQVFASPSTAAGGSANNGGLITFPTPSTAGGFSAAYFALYDAVSAGTMIGFGTFAAATVVNIGTSFQIAASGISLSLTEATGLTDLAANTLLDVLTGRIAPSVNFPAAVYMSLYTAAPTNSQTANTNETTYTGYARVSLAGLLTAATTAATSAVVTSGQVVFGTDTAGTPTILGYGVGPGASGATGLYLDQAVASQALAANNQPYIASAFTLATLS